MTKEDNKSKMDDHINITFTSFDDNFNEVSMLDESTAPLCEVIPKKPWVSKCVILHRADKVGMAKGICSNVSSNVVVGSIGLLRDSHVVVQISSSLLMADVPDDWRYSIQAWPIELVYYNGANF